MIAVEHKKTELDYCLKCRGVWFDSGELDLFLESLKLENLTQFLSDVRSAVEVTSAEKKRRCPICGRRMKKTTIIPQPRILVDVCRKGDGLWFDGGEVSQLLTGAAEKAGAKPGSHDYITNFLSEVFQHEEIA